MFLLSSSASPILRRLANCGGRSAQDPKTTDPLLAADEASEAVRYLTSGVLISAEPCDSATRTRVGNLLEDKRMAGSASISFCVQV